MITLVNNNPIDFMVNNYPLKEDFDKKIKELDDKINKMARAQAKKTWAGSRRRRRK